MSTRPNGAYNAPTRLVLNQGAQASCLSGAGVAAVGGGGRVQERVHSLSLLKMGANHSKERPQEGVLSQMKNLLKSPNNNRPVVAPAAAAARRSTSRSSSTGSPPPSPRSLADTLASQQLQASFLQFLQDLDHNDPTVPPDHCGRVGSLEFALAVKQLRIGGERNRPEDWVRFFPREKATGLALNNDPQLWQRCAEATRKVILRKSNLSYSCFTYSFL